jgi:hypothetical protein
VCCGEPGETGRYNELAAEGRREGVMAKVFTTVPGAVLRIGSHGEATNAVSCEVPEAVAAELEAFMAGEEPDPEKGIRGRAPSGEFRIVREAATPPATPKLSGEDLKKASAEKGR